MSRWHKPVCKNPSVLLDELSPYCGTCNNHCSLEELRAARRSTNAFGTVPPNEPPGQLDLWWPPAVPYINSKKKNLSTSADTTPPDLHAKSNSPLNTHSSPIYEKTLTQDEFRLACLSAPEHDDYPVHLTLETYKHNDSPDYPDYETVSYTWGGEDNDNTPSRPVFVGPYWDVLFQTKNCWDMLRSIRPWRGVRMVWIDALCINQDNFKERGEQVAKMKQIYEECFRVIVYLGPDIASPLRGRFPSRRGFEELDQYSSSLRGKESSKLELERIWPTMRDLLQKRYFSRVWVIQEVVASQRAVIRIGNVDFFIDSTTPSKLKAITNGKWDWDVCAAPWVQYMAQKSIHVEDLYQVLAATSKSRATDLRDRLFGILGLISGNAEEVALWKPDYSLSVQHVLVGLCAYLIINLKKPHLLQHASTLSAGISSPSWTPSWISDKSWESIFAPESSGRKEHNDLVKKIYKDRSNAIRNFLNHDQCIKWMRDISRSKPWDRNVVIDSNSGALSIYLTHLCVIPSQPVVLGKAGAWGAFEVSGPNARLILLSENHLDSTVILGHDHIFMLVSGDSALLYFILRSIENTLGVGNYRLVGTCPSIYIETTDDWASNGWIESLCSFITKTRVQIDDAFEAWDTHSIKALFPSANTGWDMLPAYHGFVEKDGGSNLGFENAFLSCIDSQLKPRVTEGFFEWEVVPGERGITKYTSGGFYMKDGDRSIFFDMGGFEVMWNGKWEHVLKVAYDIHKASLKMTSFDLNRTTYQLRIPVRLAEKAVRFFFASVEMIRKFMKKDSREVEVILRGGSSDDYCLTGWPHFPAMEEGFSIDGSTHQVHIH